MNHRIRRRDFLKNISFCASSTVLLSPIMNSCTQDSEEHVPTLIPKGDFGFHEGVASFDPSQESIILWSRYSPALNEDANPTILVEVALDLKFDELILSDTINLDSESDNTIRLEIKNLKPNTTYYYRFENQLTKSISPTGKTKTLPLENEISELSIAFTSCANYELGYFNVYKTIYKSEVDFVVHLGDYIYEGYRETHFQDRKHKPSFEIKSLEDYRNRYKQYRKDPDLQQLHQSKPFICIWDDHEFTNDAYMEGSPKYNKNDSVFLKRKEAAIQAWHEYLPCKSANNEIIFRSIKFGNLLSLFMLDTRLIGRDEQLTYKNYISEGKINEQFSNDWNNSDRSILGTNQKNWLIEEINASSSKWNVIGSQVLMGKHYLPAELIPLINEAQKSGTIEDEQKKEYIERISELLNLKNRSLNGDPKLTKEEISRIDNSIPYNLDAWDGYPVEREEIYQAIEGKKIITFSGASHNAWHSELTNNQGELLGHEFATSSVTSQGLELIFGQDPVILNAVEQTNVTLMDDVKYNKLNKRGFVKAIFSPENAHVEWIFVNSIDKTDFNSFSDHSYWLS